MIIGIHINNCSQVVINMIFGGVVGDFGLELSEKELSHAIGKF
jgi:hypothetical protein